MEEDIKILSHFLDGYKTVDIKGNETGEYWSGERYVKGFVYKAIENILNRLEQDERVIDKIKEYAHQEVVTYDETIKDYIDDDRVGNADYIGELRERKEHWKDIERIINNDEKLYMDWWRYGLYE